jgi:hypothetical protein
MARPAVLLDSAGYPRSGQGVLGGKRRDSCFGWRDWDSYIGVHPFWREARNEKRKTPGFAFRVAGLGIPVSVFIRVHLWFLPAWVLSLFHQRKFGETKPIRPLPATQVTENKPKQSQFFGFPWNSMRADTEVRPYDTTTLRRRDSYKLRGSTARSCALPRTATQGLQMTSDVATNASTARKECVGHTKETVPQAQAWGPLSATKPPSEG